MRRARAPSQSFRSQICCPHRELREEGAGGGSPQVRPHAVHGPADEAVQPEPGTRPSNRRHNGRGVPPPLKLWARVAPQAALGEAMAGPGSLAQASALLDMAARALEGSRQEPLTPADMLALLRLLSVAADTPAGAPGANGSQQALRELSQNFISVADGLLGPGSAPQWQAIKEVAAPAS